MFYKLLLLFLAFSCHAAQNVEDIDRTPPNKISKPKVLSYSCFGSEQGNIFTVKATSTEYIILNKKCQSSRAKATSTEYIILLVD